MCRGQFVLFTTVVARKEKIQLTTRVTKSTKFGDLLIRTLRDLRGENIFAVNPDEPKNKPTFCIGP